MRRTVSGSWRAAPWRHAARGVVLVVLAGTLGTLSCSDVSPREEDCAKACATAARCGFLPSALGGSVGLDRISNGKICRERCEASDLGEPLVQGLLDTLAAVDIPEDALCEIDRDGEPDPGRCEPLIEALEDMAATDALELTTTVTVRMSSGVSHVTKGDLEPWCCFEYDPALIAKVYPLFEPSGRCLDQMSALVHCADLMVRVPEGMEPPDGALADCTAALEGNLPPGMGPDGPIPAEIASEACRQASKLWMPPMSTASSDVCYYPSLSKRFDVIGVEDALEACDEDSLSGLRMPLEETLGEWQLSWGGTLRDENGNVRPADEIQASLELEALDELTRPTAFLDDACRDFDCTDPPTLPECRTGPACSPADCVANVSGCDPSLCKAELSPPSRDCGFFGITEVTLGYRDEDGLEVFGDPVSCGAASVETSFEDVRIGLITPIAVLSGLPSVEGGLAPSSGTEFDWFITGEPRWVTAGAAQLELPSPMLEFRADLLRNPLALLGWVLPEFPPGQACDNQPVACETYFNGNCNDGIDNDGDGFVDGGNAWCDRLMGELHDLCVTTEPGGTPPPDCNGDGAPQPPL